MRLPDADAQGRIPYVMTVPAAAIPHGVYQVRAAAKQFPARHSGTSLPQNGAASRVLLQVVAVRRQ